MEKYQGGQQSKEIKRNDQSALERPPSGRMTARTNQSQRNSTGPVGETRRGRESNQLADYQSQIEKGKDQNSLSNTQQSVLSLKEQFSRATRKNDLIQDAYKKLWAWNGEQNNLSMFSNYIMQGYLKKRASNIKFWQKKLFYRRYFKIDFTSGHVSISEQVIEDEDRRNKSQ